MSNKKVFKELYNQKINKHNNFQLILDKIESKQRRINIIKKSLIPIGSVLVICFIVLINLYYDKNNLKLNNITTSKNDDYDIYINNINESNSSFSSDIDITRKNINYDESAKSSKFNFLNEIIIPSDLNDKIYNEIYTRDYAKKNSKYDILYNYEFIYQNNNRKIILSFSDKYKPLRDYYFENNGKISKINNKEVILYQYENIYLATFTYNNINFDIETNNITKEELLNILTSIIK